MILRNLFNKKNKIQKEPERNPYVTCDYFILKDGIEHQNIGGRKAYIDRRVTLDEIRENLFVGNIATVNFVNRRPDLFESYDKFYKDPKGFVKPEGRHKRYYYVKIWNQFHDSKDWGYLGYIICSTDEVKKTFKINE